MSSNGDSPSEHPEPAIPSERTTQPELEEIHAMPLEELVRVLANRLLEDVEWKRMIAERMSKLEARMVCPKCGER
jgi:hypothetical protein